MRRINIRYNNKIETKSFIKQMDLICYLEVDLGLRAVFTLSDNIWNLNVGKSLKDSGYTFSINSKRRVGNQLSNNMTIGKL